jgi:hypothetical protein
VNPANAVYLPKYFALQQKTNLSWGAASIFVDTEPFQRREIVLGAFLVTDSRTGKGFLPVSVSTGDIRTEVFFIGKCPNIECKKSSRLIYLAI